MEKESSFKNTVSIQVRFSDVDMMGHVSNTIYQNYYDSGKLHYFDEVIPDMDFTDIGVVGASIKIDYLKPIFMKTKILVKTRISIIGHKSITMEHLLVKEEDHEVVSTCTAVLVCYSIKDKISIPIPNHWRNNIIAYEDTVVFK